MSNNVHMKTLQELNLLDRFLFARTIEDIGVYQAMLEILLGEDIHLLTLPQTEKELRTAPWLRSIRVDVYSMDEKKRIFNAEPQGKNTYNLPKRSRYYSALIDSSLLPPGSKDFNSLNDTIQIMIMPFDLFGYGKYRYTFQMKCKEVEELELDDGAIRIFFNTHGTNPEEVSSELVELVKSSEEMGVRYMQEWEEKAILVEEAEERINQLAQKLAALNRIDDFIRSTTDKQFQKQLFQEFDLYIGE